MALIRKIPPADRQTLPPIAWCRFCLAEIYEGEDYYSIDGRAVCTGCLPRLAEEYFGACRITGGA